MKKNEESGIGKQEPVRTLTKEHINAFNAIAMNKTRVKLDQEAITDDVKALAEKLGWSAKKISSTITMMMKEQEKGGALQESSEIVEMVEQILGVSATDTDSASN